MTQGQTRVLVLLLVLLGLEVLISPVVRGTVGGIFKGQVNGTPLWQMFQLNGAGLPAPAAGLLGYSVAGLALLALAGPAPQLATWLMVLLILLVLLTNGNEFAAIITTAGNGVQALASSPSSSSSSSASSASAVSGGSRGGVK